MISRQSAQSAVVRPSMVNSQSRYEVGEIRMDVIGGLLEWDSDIANYQNLTAGRIIVVLRHPLLWQFTRERFVLHGLGWARQPSPFEHPFESSTAQR
jgi:hypothetical protein